MLSLPNGPIPRSTQGHRQSAGFPSRRKPQAPGPPDQAPFLSRQCPASVGWAARIRDIHAPILASFVAHHFRVRAGHPLPRGSGGGAATRGVV